MPGGFMVTFEDMQGKILAGVGIVIVSWGGFITSEVLDSPSKGDIEKMIENAQNSSFYAQERVSIQKSIQDLYDIVHNLAADRDRMKDSIGVNNDKIVAGDQQLWTAVGDLRVEIEKVKLMLEHSDAGKKKRIEEEEEQPTSTPSFDQAGPPAWRKLSLP